MSLCPGPYFFAYDNGAKCCDSNKDGSGADISITSLTCGDDAIDCAGSSSCLDGRKYFNNPLLYFYSFKFCNTLTFLAHCLLSVAPDSGVRGIKLSLSSPPWIFDPLDLNQNSLS